jgi:hypothetical protein
MAERGGLTLSFGVFGWGWFFCGGGFVGVLMVVVGCDSVATG